MSLYDYEKSKEILKGDPTFASLIMAVAKKSNVWQFEKLNTAFPKLIDEYSRRRHSPGGLLDGDEGESQ